MVWYSSELQTDIPNQTNNFGSFWFWANWNGSVRITLYYGLIRFSYYTVPWKALAAVSKLQLINIKTQACLKFSLSKGSCIIASYCPNYILIIQASKLQEKEFKQHRSSIVAKQQIIHLIDQKVMTSIWLPVIQSL